MSKFTDTELLKWLYENDYELTEENLKILENVLSLDEKEKEEDCEKESEAVEIEPGREVIQDSIPDAEIQKEPKNVDDKEIKKDEISMMNFFKSNTNEFLEAYLKEECGFTEYSSLNEEVKTDAVKNIVINLLKTVEEKMQDIDTAFIDRTRGDIKLLKELSPIQDSITQLEAILERSQEFIPNAKEYIGVIIKTIMFLNQYSSTFKDAYRNKKTLLILRYQSLILSVVSSLSYLISALLDFSKGVELKKTITIEEIAPLKNLKEFNKSVETGEFKKIIGDTNVLREYYTEIEVKEMSRILEAGEILPMIMTGIKNLYSNIGNSQKITNIVYKTTGVLVILLSIRTIIYTLYRMRTNVQEILQNIQNFANINIGSPISKLHQFANKFKVDIENGSDIADREINDENKKVSSQIKIAKAESLYEPEVNSVIDSTNTTELPMDFNFDF